MDPYEGVVHVSHDEGKNWAKADIPSEASMIIEHPFDNNYVRRCVHLLLSCDKGLRCEPAPVAASCNAQLKVGAQALVDPGTRTLIAG